MELAERYGVDGEELYRRTGGDPFFVIEVLAAGGRPDPRFVGFAASFHAWLLRTCEHSTRSNAAA
jgi:hypothetical protein